MNNLYQSADWKAEKHVPVIEAAKKGELLEVSVAVGKEIAHPNTTAHHIEWIEVYFHPAGEKFPFMIGTFDFSAHGSSVEGADTSTVYTEPKVTCFVRTGKNGTLHAASYCNIHGLWNSSIEFKG